MTSPTTSQNTLQEIQDLAQEKTSIQTGLNASIRNTTEHDKSNNEKRSLKAIKILLPVWGSQYVQHFLEFCLPSLLAKGNLPDLAKDLACEFQFLTTRASESLIKDHPGFARLTAICPVSFHFIDHLVTARNYSTTLTLAYTEAVRVAGQEMLRTCFIFLTSDYIMAMNSLASVLAEIKAGVNAVLVGNFQVIAEQALPQLKSQLGNKPDLIELDSKQMLSWAFKYLHPVTIANIVNNPLSHSEKTNRLFWQVNKDTLLGRFYLMHMIAIWPEVDDFLISGPCDYSFVPEMCPSGKISVITDSDRYCVIEAQPLNHEADSLRPGEANIQELANSLSEWATQRHRENSSHSIVFHASDLPANLKDTIEQADSYINHLNRKLRPKAQPYRHHPYWLGAITAFKEAKGQALNKKERYWLEGKNQTFAIWLRYIQNLVFGSAPNVYLWHPRFADYQFVLNKLQPVLEDQQKAAIVISEIPTPFTLMLARRGENFYRAETSVFLKNNPDIYSSYCNRFDICLLELAPADLGRAKNILDRLFPLMKKNSTILLHVNTGQLATDHFVNRVTALAEQFINSPLSIEEISFIPVNSSRRLAYNILGTMNRIIQQKSWLEFPLLPLYFLPLLFISCLANLFTSGKPNFRNRAISSLNIIFEKKNTDLSNSQDQNNQHTETRSKNQSSIRSDSTAEPQYNDCLDLKDKIGLTPLGLMTNQVWHDDPRRLTFVLSRYKFVAKMLSGLEMVAELGCGDAFGTRIVLQEVEQVAVYDFDPIFINDIRSRENEEWPLEACVHNILNGPLPQRYNAIYSLDVFEHINKVDEKTFLTNLRDSLESDGILIIGTPSIESQNYASPQSKIGHVNCKNGQELKDLLKEYFHSVFVFSMNDEVVHTGFYPLAHYLFALCVHKKA